MSKKTLAKSQQPKAKSQKPKVVKWEYVTEPFDVMVLPALFTRLHSPLTPWLSSLTENCYVHLRPCVQGVDEYGVVVKYLYCTRDGRFFTRRKDGWIEIKPDCCGNNPKSKGGSSDCPQFRNYGWKPCHRCVAFAWCNPPKEVIEQVSDDNLGAPNANQQSVCGGEEPRHTSPLCRPAASDATVLPKAWEVDHLNTDHKNWTADNLQWVTVEENRRRGAIAKLMRQIGLNPKWLTPTLMRGILTMPAYMVVCCLNSYKRRCKADASALSIEAIRLNFAKALDDAREESKKWIHIHRLRPISWVIKLMNKLRREHKRNQQKQNKS